MRKRIYVAGPYSCDNRCKPLGVDLEYMREGLEASVKLLSMGYAPFCPWLDYLFQLVPGGHVLTREDYYEYSIAWLGACDAMVVIKLREGSYGTQMEINVAKNLGIPVYYGMSAFLRDNRDG